MIKLLIKDRTVWIGEVNYEFVTAIRVVCRIYQRRNKVPVLTSGNDATHSKDSWHYKNLGWDFRVWGIDNPDTKQIDEMEICANEIREELKSIDYHYDVIYKDKKPDGTYGHTDHMHIEYDFTKKRTVAEA